VVVNPEKLLRFMLLVAFESMVGKSGGRNSCLDRDPEETGTFLEGEKTGVAARNFGLGSFRNYRCEVEVPLAGDAFAAKETGA